MSWTPLYAAREDSTLPQKRDWSDDKLLGYIEEHSKTPRALFHKDDIFRLILLANGDCEHIKQYALWPTFMYVPHHDAAPLLERARRRIA
jgi:hypothetical protein